MAQCTHKTPSKDHAETIEALLFYCFIFIFFLVNNGFTCVPRRLLFRIVSDDENATHLPCGAEGVRRIILLTSSDRNCVKSSKSVRVHYAEVYKPSYGRHMGFISLF